MSYTSIIKKTEVFQTGVSTLQGIRTLHWVSVIVILSQILSDVYSGYYGGNSHVCVCVRVFVCVCVRVCVRAQALLHV